MIISKRESGLLRGPVLPAAAPALRAQAGVIFGRYSQRRALWN